MAVLVHQAIGKTHIQELFVEGGATAKSILTRMNWNTLDVLGEYCPGMVRLAIKGQQDTAITIKPGSYLWPNGLWTQCLQQV